METYQKSNLLEIVLSMLLVTFIVILILRRDAIITLLHAKAAGPQYEPLVLQIERSIEDCYSVLGCDSKDSDDEIKARYRHLVKVFHTDKLGPDLPGEIRELSTEQFRRVQEAYDQIREMRGFP
ncbi:MAG: DnaJ domain-containing protein [Bdellovibrionales bacterium]|nr:DnaJ domain-containing protein [Bdellovibrionales bacterium]